MQNTKNLRQNGEKTMQKPVFIDTDKLPASEAVVKLMLERSGHSALEILASLEQAQMVYDYSRGRIMCSKEKKFHKASRKMGYLDITDELIEELDAADFVDRYSRDYLNENGIVLTEDECKAFVKRLKIVKQLPWISHLNISNKNFFLLRDMSDVEELYVATEESKHVGELDKIKVSEQSKSFILDIVYKKLKSQYDAIMNKEHLVKKGSLDMADLVLAINPK